MCWKCYDCMLLAAACDVIEMENAKRVLAIIGKFGVTGTFACIYIHTSELFPTEVRGIGVGFASAGGRIGGIFAPLVLQFGYKLSWLPFFVFGCFGLVQVITCKNLWNDFDRNYDFRLSTSRNSRSRNARVNRRGRRVLQKSENAWKKKLLASQATRWITVVYA